MKNIKNLPEPIFILSLPRSGSTLLQRLLASCDEIETCSEPWILLPYLYSLKPDGVCADYWHSTASQAINEFCMIFPNGLDDYYELLSIHVKNLYGIASTNNTIYFLDKTPRYHLIIDEIFKLFPNGKYIFLWRNPLAIAASLMETWGGGKWNLYKFNVDLFSGILNLTNAFQRYKSRVCSLRYEDLINNTQRELEIIYHYLGLPNMREKEINFTDVDLIGSKGDQTGSRQYLNISKEPLSKWNLIMSNPLRRYWSRYYLNWIGTSKLNLMGYDMDVILNNLNSYPTIFDNTSSDLLNFIWGVLYNFFDLYCLKQKLHQTKGINSIHFRS